MIERIAVVSKPTEFEELLRRHHTRAQAAFFIERRGGSISDAEMAHAASRGALDTLLRSLPSDIPHVHLRRDEIPTFLFRANDLVIAIGPDGLVVNVAKYLNGQPLLTVNPDPARIGGVLMRFAAADVPGLIQVIRNGNMHIESLAIAEAKTNDGQVLRAVNDFIVGRRDPVSARYMLSFNGTSERQSSSGVLVSTGTGSSGWMTSVLRGANGLLGQNTKQIQGRDIPFPRDARRLLFAVREPFASKATGANLVTGWIEEGTVLRFSSEMAEGGAIFSDGIVEDAIEFNAGTTVTIGLADQSVRLVQR